MLALRSTLRRDLLAWFLENRSGRAYVRQLAQKIGADSTNVSRELARLEQQGLLVSEREGRQLYYKIDRQNSNVRPLFQMLEKTVGVNQMLRRVLLKIPGLRQAWIYGSFAKGGVDTSSDIDLLLVGTPEQRELASTLRQAEKKLDRQINYTVLTLPEVEKRLADQDPFLSDIWQGRRIDLIGASEDSSAEAKSEASPAVSRRRRAQGASGSKQSRHR